MEHHDIPLRQVLSKFLALYVPLSLLVVAAAYWIVQEQREVSLAHYRTEALHHVEGQVDRIQRFYRQGLLMVRGFSRDSAVLPALRGDSSAQDEAAKVFANILASLASLDRLCLLDTQGREILRVERRVGGVIRAPRHGLRNESHRDFVRQALRLSPGSMYISPLEVKEQGQAGRSSNAVIRFVSVVGDEKNQHVIGLLVANFLGSELLRQELDETGLPGEHLMINAGSRWWFDHHEGRLVVLDDETKLMAKYSLDKERWRQLMHKGMGQVVDRGALLTIASYRPNGARDPMRAVIRPFPIQQEWRIVSYVPLGTAWMVPNLFGIVSGVLAVLILTGLFLLLRVRYQLWIRESERQLQSMMRTNQRLLRQLFRVQEDERARLARLLHDEIGQRLTALQMQAEAVGKLCSTRLKDYAMAREHVNTLQKGLHELVALMRDQLRSFRPPPLRELGLTGTIRAHCDKWSRDTGIRCEKRLDSKADSMGYDDQIQLFRIVQEALTNVARHAGASCVWLSLSVVGDELLMVIEDDGKGFAPQQATEGLGLAGMRERAHLLGGILRLERTSMGGTRVILHVPGNKNNPILGSATS